MLPFLSPELIKTYPFTRRRTMDIIFLTINLSLVTLIITVLICVKIEKEAKFIERYDRILTMYAQKEWFLYVAENNQNVWCKDRNYHQMGKRNTCENLREQNY